MGENIKQVELTDTVELMISADYKDRFKAEYYQIEIRYNKLKAMCEKWDQGELDFTPTCPRALYSIQIQAMGTYLATLANRAELEGIEL